MLKKIIESTEGLHEELAKMYVKKDDGKFHLQLENDDAEPLRRAKEHEVGLRQIAERDRDALKVQLEEAAAKIGTLEGAQSQDAISLRADHERAVAALKTQHSQELSGMEGVVKKMFVTDVAHRIAKDIAIDDGSAELLADNLLRRLAVEMVSGSPVTRVVAADGTASNASPDDLKQEYLQNPKYAAILRANGASGGGASGGNKGGGASSKKLADMNDTERNTMQKENPGEWTRIVAEAKAEAQ